MSRSGRARTRRSGASAVAIALLAVPVALAGACGDPVHDDAVAALGEEAPGVSPGPLHRPGQPCTVCHGGSGPAGMVFALAGTVYAAKGLARPISGVQVSMTDTTGHVEVITTNAAGNFSVRLSDWVPVYPVNVSVQYRLAKAPMNTHIGREGSCAACHTATIGPTSPGPVFVFQSPEDAP